LGYILSDFFKTHLVTLLTSKLFIIISVNMFTYILSRPLWTLKKSTQCENYR
jgi:hypothetical protein